MRSFTHTHTRMYINELHNLRKIENTYQMWLFYTSLGEKFQLFFSYHIEIFLPLADCHIYSKIWIELKIHTINKSSISLENWYMFVFVCVHFCNRIVVEVFDIKITKKKCVTEFQSVQKTGSNCALHDLHYCNISMFKCVVFFHCMLTFKFCICIFFVFFLFWLSNSVAAVKQEKQTIKTVTRCNPSNINQILTFISPFCPKEEKNLTRIFSLLFHLIFHPIT